MSGRLHFPLERRRDQLSRRPGVRSLATRVHVPHAWRRLMHLFSCIPNLWTADISFYMTAMFQFTHLHRTAMLQLSVAHLWSVAGLGCPMLIDECVPPSLGALFESRTRHQLDVRLGIALPFAC